MAETEKIANAPAGNRTRDPSKRGRCSTIEPPRQATSPASLFEILSVLPPLHNIGIIQCPQTKPASLGEPVTVAIVHRARPERIVIKGINAKSEILKRKRKVEGRGRGKERKRKRKKEEGKGGREIGSEASAETCTLGTNLPGHNAIVTRKGKKKPTSTSAGERRFSLSALSNKHRISKSNQDIVHFSSQEKSRKNV